MSKIAIIIVNPFSEPLFCLSLATENSFEDVNALCLVKECFSNVFSKTDYRLVDYATQFRKDVTVAALNLLRKTKETKGISCAFIENHIHCASYGSIVYVSGFDCGLIEYMKSSDKPVFPQDVYEYHLTKKGDNGRYVVNFGSRKICDISKTILPIRDSVSGEINTNICCCFDITLGFAS